MPEPRSPPAPPPPAPGHPRPARGTQRRGSADSGTSSLVPPGQSTQLGCLGTSPVPASSEEERDLGRVYRAWGRESYPRGCLRAQRRAAGWGWGVRRKGEGGGEDAHRITRKRKAVVHPTEPSGDHFCLEEAFLTAPTHPPPTPRKEQETTPTPNQEAGDWDLENPTERAGRGLWSNPTCPDGGTETPGRRDPEVPVACLGG